VIVYIFGVGQIFGLPFQGLKLCVNFDENEFGYTLGNYFINSSGHPGCYTHMLNALST
jgi:hypothetical protein